MSSKKQRKSLSHFYNSVLKGCKKKRNPPPDQSKLKAADDKLAATTQKPKSILEIKKEINNILDSLKNFSVIFPEINSEPMKLGVPLEVTFQIGNDKP